MAIQHYHDWERQVFDKQLRDAIMRANVVTTHGKPTHPDLLNSVKLWHAVKVAMVTLSLGIGLIGLMRFAPEWFAPLLNFVDHFIVSGH